MRYARDPKAPSKVPPSAITSSPWTQSPQHKAQLPPSHHGTSSVGDTTSIFSTVVHDAKLCCGPITFSRVHKKNKMQSLTLIDTNERPHEATLNKTLRLIATHVALRTVILQPPLTLITNDSEFFFISKAQFSRPSQGKRRRSKQVKAGQSSASSALSKRSWHPPQPHRRNLSATAAAPSPLTSSRTFQTLMVSGTK